MKILFIGGTGTISSAITKELLNQNKELYLINRGSRNSIFKHYDNLHEIKADINNEEEVKSLINDLEFDVVVDFIAFTTTHLERDYRLFQKKTKQFIFISSASAYQKPPKNYTIDEDTELKNPYWEYSNNKILAENYLMEMFEKEQFPVTIVRPSHTYDERSVPLGVHGKNGSWQVVKRIKEGKPVIIHGDGTSLWTMTHNSDFAKAFIGLLGNQKAIGEKFQITSDEVLTWNQIYENIAEALAVKLNPYHIASDFLAKCSNYDFWGSLIGDKANSVVFDNSKVKKLVPDFKAKKSFKEGVKETIAFILSHPELQHDDVEFDQWCDKVIDELDNTLKRLKL